MPSRISDLVPGGVDFTDRETVSEDADLSRTVTFGDTASGSLELNLVSRYTIIPMNVVFNIGTKNLILSVEAGTINGAPNIEIPAGEGRFIIADDDGNRFAL